MIGKNSVKAVILVAGPQKGTRFRPLSLEVPKPLFPVAGCPLVEHHIAACKKVEEIDEVILLGFYQSNERISRFIDDMRRKYSMKIRYLQEYQPLGTAGGLYHFRDQISSVDSSAIIVIHADIFCVLPLKELLDLYSVKNESSPGSHVVLGTQVHKTPLSQSEHGNMVINKTTSEVTHYVEKPENYVSGVINCGVYAFHPSVLDSLAEIYRNNQVRLREEVDGNASNPEMMFIEKHLFSHIAGSGKLYCLMLSNSFWGSMKSAGSAIFANRQYLASYKKDNFIQLAENSDGTAEIVGDVYIHPSAIVDPTAKIGPNVSIGSNCVIGPGARVRESIVLDNAELRENCCVLNSIIGWKCLVGAWSRIEGTAHDPNPNHPHALISNESLFHPDGHLIPSITVLGCNVVIPREVIVLNSIVLPHKELNGSHKNQIIL
ncbi:mannose-1-phosphate guanyltransferase alpha-A-like [Hydractinia symbiolongicarpus]|uniref:mannose-1-phosphate guanyltransferase alpha-A-like n=1 Tax=Hydractinia symbiolongicarpus TaxID=13093 RepID=UPI00254EF141|nr:mannose-1-phosphate guanyltransferase alpha-A-like [Hydractinia symbiolongicarpus]